MIAIPIVVCLCGFFIYLTVPAGKLEELGRITFWVGLSACLITTVRFVGVPVVVCLCGFLTYLTVPAGKLAELGRIMFWVGLTVSLLAIIRIMAISDARKMISRFDYTSATPQTALAQDREPASHAAEFPGRL